MPNGAVIAAPVHQPYYPKNAKSYIHVWPGRDLGFALAAMILIGEDYYEQTLTWLWERAEDFQTSVDPMHEGLIFRNYHVNGSIYLHHLQPDQNGTLLWSINFKKQITKKKLSKLEKQVVIQAADALARIWHNGHFSLNTEDLWEEIGIRPHVGNFTYSLASCAVGLESAYQITKDNKYLKTSRQMKTALKKYPWSNADGYIPRRFNANSKFNNTLDGSMAALVWPFNTGLPKKHLKNTLEKIEEKLISKKAQLGVMRYPRDMYAGSQGDWHNYKNEHAGAWPLLTFWLSIAYNEIGDKQKAEKYFNMVFDNIGDDYFIPEQLFCCPKNGWQGIKPLLWSNAMAIIAAWKLGYLKK